MDGMDAGSRAALGGIARREALSPAKRKDIAKRAIKARWDKAKEKADPNRLPEAKWKGVLRLVGVEVPCYVLDDGQRVIGRTSATEMLTGIKGGGGLEKYLGVSALKPFIDGDLMLEKMVPFRLP